jgi:riboflavin kinase/FMN adenylyltransferase
MKLIRRGDEARSLPPCVLAISDFDGMHGDHRCLLASAGGQARAGSHALAALMLAPARRTARDMGNLRDALVALQRAGVDYVVIRRCSAEAVTSMAALPNVRQVLMSEAAQQQRASAALADAVARADFATLRELLDHPFSVSGHVVHGRKLGRTMGFPTLNLKMKHGPGGLRGIYVVMVHGLAPRPLPAVASVGVRPTVERDGEPLLEVHIMQAIGLCYGKIVRVEFLHKLRDERHFDGLEALQAAIDADVEAASRYFVATAA